ncbi:MAG TPA: BON domain-containing protein [Pseudomonadales bacterium]|nr:BON domain-containing protein [Pseudomonadales bacterium]
MIRKLRFLELFVFALSLSACALFSGNDPGVRTPATVWSDDMIEYRTDKAIKDSDPRFESSHIVVVSHSGIVLLVGEVESEELKTKAGDVAQNIENVRSVHNELTIGGPISLVARSNDSWLTTKVKTKLIAHGAIDSTRIDVTTENGVVYLMGSVPQEQARYAVEVTQTVYGVEKIVKVFEYTD